MTSPLHAQKAKRARASSLNRVRDGALPLRDALWDGHDSLRTCSVYHLLMATPSMGKETTRTVLERANVWPMEELQNLSKLQRRAIINALPRRVK